MNSEAAFVALSGVSPVAASSGRIVRHRLNRGGNRQANNALWRIATNRMRHDPHTKEYATRRQAQGKTHTEIIRCLKRHIAREIYHLLTDPPPTPHGTDLRHRRQQARITLTRAAHHLDTQPTVLSQLERGPTTTTSLPDTNTGSPNNRFAQHRSIIEASHFQRACNITLTPNTSTTEPHISRRALTMRQIGENSPNKSNRFLAGPGSPCGRLPPRTCLPRCYLDTRREVYVRGLLP